MKKTVKICLILFSCCYAQAVFAQGMFNVLDCVNKIFAGDPACFDSKVANSISDDEFKFSNWTFLGGKGIDTNNNPRIYDPGKKFSDGGCDTIMALRDGGKATQSKACFPDESNSTAFNKSVKNYKYQLSTTGDYPIITLTGPDIVDASEQQLSIPTDPRLDFTCSLIIDSYQTSDDEHTKMIDHKDEYFICKANNTEAKRVIAFKKT